MPKPFSWTVKQVAVCVVVAGLSGAALVWAAPKAKTKAPSSSKSKAPVAKSSAGKPTATKKSTPQTKKASSAAKISVTQKANVVATKVNGAQVQTDKTGFTPSRFPGVVVRSVPSASPVMTSDLATAVGGPVISNVRPAPGGGMMADVKFPREVETLDNLVAEKESAQKAASKDSPKR